MGIILAIKKARTLLRPMGNHRGKIMVEPSHTAGGKHQMNNDHTILNAMAGEENSIIDFEELNRTVESPKGIHGDKKANFDDHGDTKKGYTHK